MFIIESSFLEMLRDYSSAVKRFLVFSQYTKHFPLPNRICKFSIQKLKEFGLLTERHYINAI